MQCINPAIHSFLQPPELEFIYRYMKMNDLFSMKRCHTLIQYNFKNFSSVSSAESLVDKQCGPNQTAPTGPV